MALFLILLACGPAAPAAIGADPVPGDNPCAECLVGPIELVIEKGAARTYKTRFDASPQDDYTLVVERLGEPKAGALVHLNGGVLLDFRTELPLGNPAYIPVSLLSSNLFRVEIRGVPGARIRFVLVTTASLPPSRQPCRDRMTFFDRPPADPAATDDVIPLGILSPPAHTLPTHHLYLNAIFAIPGDPASAATFDVVSPGRAEIVAVVRNSADNHQIHMQPCRQIRTYFEVRTLDPAIEDRLTPEGWVCFAGTPEEGTCAQRTSIVVDSGQRLASAPAPSLINLAWGLIDHRRPPLPFVNPARYDLSLVDVSAYPPEIVALAPYIMPERLQQFCPADYLVPEERDAFLLRTGRSDEPKCGEIEQDEPGTAQGNWFSGPTANDSDESTAMALVHHYVTPAVPLFSVSSAFCASDPGGGETCSWLPGRYTFTPLATGRVNRDFDDVTPGAVHCYDNLSHATTLGAEPGRVLVEVFGTSRRRPANRLRLEPIARSVSDGCGPGPWSFGSGVREFQR